MLGANTVFSAVDALLRSLPFANRNAWPNCIGSFEDDSADSEPRAERYFSFTKSNTKIAHTPTVMGNCTKEASRSGPPLGRRYVAAIIARAVNTPSKNLLFQFMCSPTLPRPGA